MKERKYFELKELKKFLKRRNISYKRLSDELGISYRTLYQRISVRHWDTDKALGTKENASIKQITYNGKTQTMKEWANEVGINYRTLAARLNQYHWSIEKALTTK